ncbi:MAG: hypothetical protein K8R77_15320 [Anaerolineaceae bacterium]|nr:hypothetical protein [Anaerolineaceae bacterium]
MMLVFVITACGGEAASGGAYVWIDVPLNGITIPGGQPVQVEGHASHPGGIDKVEVNVNGQLVEMLQGLSTTGNLSSFVYSFNPPQPGEYVIQVVAYAAGGKASEPDSARIRVGEQAAVLITNTPTPVSSWTPTFVPTPTFTPTPPPDEAVVQFQAEPAEIDAGDCSRLVWHVENVQSVVFGGVDQAFDGSYEVCLCETKYYPLTVIYLDGSSEKFTVEVKVNGVCATPVPEDTTPPPVPSPVVPANGLEIGCKSSQSLAWLPVEDPSGISGYQVEVQRHSGDNNWQGVSGSIFNSSGKTIDVSVECGWYYRWRVRATDGKGNQSNWSGWFQFTIVLS